MLYSYEKRNKTVWVDHAYRETFPAGIFERIPRPARRGAVVNGDHVHGMVYQKTVTGKQATAGIFIAQKNFVVCLRKDAFVTSLL